QDAILMAHALRIEALADDGVVVAGQPLRVSTTVVNRGPDDVTIDRIALDGFDGVAVCPPARMTSGGTTTCTSDPRIPAAARLTTPYWRRPPEAGRATYEDDTAAGLPFRPTPFRASVDLRIG